MRRLEYLLLSLVLMLDLVGPRVALGYQTTSRNLSDSSLGHIVSEPKILRQVAISAADEFKTLSSMRRKPNRSKIPGDQRVAVWISNVDSQIFSSKAKMRQVLLELRQLGVNTLYPVVWNKGYSIGPSLVAERSLGTGQMPEYSGTDPLAWIFEIIAEEQLDFEVIGWFEYGLKVPFDVSPAGILARQRGWLLINQQGSDIAELRAGSVAIGYLNPLVKEVQLFMQDFVEELLHRYPGMMGVQLDDNFSIDPSMGYNPEVLAAFHQSLVSRKLEQYRWDVELDNPSDRDLRERLWHAFRVVAVGNLARLVFDRARMVRSDVMTQISPAGTIDFSYTQWLQDWRFLVHNFVVDELVVQAYRRDLISFEAVLEDSSVLISKSRMPVSVGIFTGFKNNSIPTEVIVEQIKKARALGYGVSFFFQESLLGPADDTNQRQKRLQRLRETLQ